MPIASTAIVSFAKEEFGAGCGSTMHAISRKSRVASPFMSHCIRRLWSSPSLSLHLSLSSSFFFSFSLLLSPYMMSVISKRAKTLANRRNYFLLLRARNNDHYITPACLTRRNWLRYYRGTTNTRIQRRREWREITSGDIFTFDLISQHCASRHAMECRHRHKIFSRRYSFAFAPAAAINGAACEVHNANYVFV